MDLPKELRYTKTHEWIRFEDDMVEVGITDFAQEQLGDLTYVELPELGAELSAQDEAAVIESVKAASDIYAPVSGEVTEVNAILEDSPELVNSEPYGDGWLFRMRISDVSELEQLMDADEYEDMLPDDA